MDQNGGRDPREYRSLRSTYKGSSATILTYVTNHCDRRLVTGAIGWSVTVRRIQQSASMCRRLDAMKDGLDLCAAATTPACRRMWTEFWNMPNGVLALRHGSLRNDTRAEA